VTYLPVYHPSPAEKANPQLYADNVREAMFAAMVEYDPAAIKTSHSYEDVRLLTKAQKLYRGSIDDVSQLNMCTDFTFSDASSLLKMDIEKINMLLGKFRAIDVDGGGYHLPDPWRSALSPYMLACIHSPDYRRKYLLLIPAPAATADDDDDGAAAADDDDDGAVCSFDRTIDATEFASAMNLDLADPCTEHLFAILDPNGHRCFDFCSLLQGLALMSGALGDEEKIKLVFSMYDADSDGQVTHTELVAMMRRKPLVPSQEDPHATVKMSLEQANETAAALLDGKDSITLEEFQARIPDHPKVMDYALRDLRKFAEIEN